MALTINAAGFHSAAEKAGAAERVQAEGRKSVYGGNSLLADPIGQRRDEARRQAWKVVKNAWANDQYIDDSIAERRGHYASLEKLYEELRTGLSDADREKESLREQFGVAPDSKEQQDLELLEKEKFDLIFTDIRMPFVDGIEMLRTLSERGSLIPVIFASSYDEFEYAKEGLGLGAFVYLLKPVDQK